MPRKWRHRRFVALLSLLSFVCCSAEEPARAEHQHASAQKGRLVLHSDVAFISLINNSVQTNAPGKTSFSLNPGQSSIVLFPASGTLQKRDLVLEPGKERVIRLQSAVSTAAEPQRTVKTFAQAALWRPHIMACIQKNFNNEAHLLLRKALQRFPKDSDLWYLEALNRQQMKKNEAALTAAERYIELNPNGRHNTEMMVLRQKLSPRMDDRHKTLQEP